MKVIDLNTGEDITHLSYGKRLTKPQVKLRLAKYRRQQNKKNRRKRK